MAVTVITGTRTGLGRALALHFLNAGDTVVGCSRTASDLVHPAYEHHCLDVGDDRAIRGLMTAIRRRHGGIRVLINNAGIAAMNHALMTPSGTLDALLRTNVIGTFAMSREAARLMRGQAHARIVNLSSVAVPLRLAGESAYAASKAAVESLTRTLARELAPLGITCNAVGPTPIATDLIRNVPADKIDALVAAQAIHRLGEPADVINVVDFLVRPQSDFVTGQVIYLGGVG